MKLSDISNKQAFPIDNYKQSANTDWLADWNPKKSQLPRSWERGQILHWLSGGEKIVTV